MALMSLARPGPRPAATSELREALSACWHAFIAVGLMSGLINMLYLTGSFYMLEVYDRVLPSRSVPTLVALSVLALTLFAFQGALDVISSRIMIRVADTLDVRMSTSFYRGGWEVRWRDASGRRRVHRFPTEAAARAFDEAVPRSPPPLAEPTRPGTAAQVASTRTGPRTAFAGALSTDAATGLRRRSEDSPANARHAMPDGG